MKVKSETEVAQSCLTLSDPMDCSLPGSSVHGIFQARALEWGASAFSEFLGYAPWRYGANILCYQMLSFLKLRLHWWLRSDDCLMMDTPCFHPEFPLGSLGEGLQLLMPVTYSVSDMAGSVSFLTTSHVSRTFALLPTTSAALDPAVEDHCPSLNLISAKASAPSLQPAPMFKVGKNKASFQKFLIKHQSYSDWTNLEHVPTSEPTAVARESQVRS